MTPPVRSEPSQLSSIENVLLPMAEPPRQLIRDDICKHIFTASATLVGVCLTVIGLLNVLRGLRGVTRAADTLLSLDAVGFLAACVISYTALRTDDGVRRRRIERYADVVFLAALAVMTAVCGLFAFELV